MEKLKKLDSVAIKLDPEAYIVAASPDGLLAAVSAPTSGSTEVQIVDVAKRTLVGKLDYKAELWSLCWSPDSATVYVGAKTIGAIDVKTLKKTKLALKGCKSAPRSLAISADGKRLYAATGSAIYSDDCFVRAFDVATGKEAWKAKPKTQVNGFTSVAVHGEIVLASSSSRVFAFDAAGKIVGDVEVAEGAVCGGVASNGTRIVASWKVDDKLGATFLGFDKKALACGKAIDLPFAMAAKPSLQPTPPSASGDRAAFATYYVDAKGFGQYAAFCIDLTKQTVVGAYALDAGDVNKLRLSLHAGQLLWPSNRGLAISKLA